jgi:hypothetical protein
MNLIQNEAGRRQNPNKYLSAGAIFTQTISTTRGTGRFMLE